MEHNLSQIASSYKLNSSIVKRMTSRVIIDSHRNEHPGCSKLMIAAMIHFSHICSTKGVIERIKVSELSFVLRCNIRSAYTVLAELEKRVNSDCVFAFSMSPTSISELFEVADAGKLMPPKSTWFEPKLRSGLFIHGI